MMTNLGNYYEYYELCVAAAFMDRKNLYGVPEEVPPMDIRQVMLRVVSRMEQKNMLEIGMDGIVLIDKQLYRAVQYMTGAVRVGRLVYTGDAFPQTVYLYRSGSHGVVSAPQALSGTQIRICGGLGGMRAALEAVFGTDSTCLCNAQVLARKGMLYCTVLEEGEHSAEEALGLLWDQINITEVNHG